MALPVYFLLLMADGRKLQKALLDRLPLSPGQSREGQDRLIAAEYGTWADYPSDREGPGNGHDAQPGDSPDSDRVGADRAL